MDIEGKDARHQFFQNLFRLLRKEKQTFKDLARYNKHTGTYCYCFEGLIGLALGGEVVDNAGLVQIKLPTELSSSESNEDNLHDTILKPEVYNRFLPSQVKIDFLLKHKDKLELTETQVKMLPDRPALDWRELNDKIQLNFIQFKILLREIFYTYNRSTTPGQT